MKLGEVAYKIFRGQASGKVIKLVELGFFVVPYKGPKQPGLTRYRDLLEAEYSIEKILSAWERVKDTGFEWYGVLMGRPSNYLVMVNIDDAETTRAVEEGREQERERILDDLAAKIEKILPKTNVGGLGVALPTVLQTRTRRGVHILLRLSKCDYEKLETALGKANVELGETEFQGHKLKVELRIKGATPLETQYHRTRYWQLPLPALPLHALEKLLQSLGIGNLPTSTRERSCAAEGGKGNRDVQKHIVRHEEHTLLY